MTLTKEKIMENICNQCGYSKTMSGKLFESFFEIIKKTLESGEDVLISGFGKFCVKKKQERRGRNPSTGEDMVLRSRQVVTFKFSSILKEKING